jgi:hypothetical protein
VGKRGRCGEGVRPAVVMDGGGVKSAVGRTWRREGGMRTTGMGCEDGGRGCSPFYRAEEAGRWPAWL